MQGSLFDFVAGDRVWLNHWDTYGKVVAVSEHTLVIEAVNPHTGRFDRSSIWPKTSVARTAPAPQVVRHLEAAGQVAGVRYPRETAAPQRASQVPPQARDDWATGAALANGERQDDYGHPAINFKRIAALWTGILDHPVTEEDVALCMIAVKVAREKNKHKGDNLDDIEGYVECLRIIVDYRESSNV